MSTRPKCPICRKAPTEAFAPFCSRGCKDRDLLKWLGDGYAIAGPAVDDMDAELGGLDSDEGRG